MPKAKGHVASRGTSKAFASMDRVSRVRRLIEEEEDSDLFSPDFVSHAPWDLAVKRRTRSAATAARTFFNPENVLSGKRITVEEVVEDCDKVVVRWRARGKWTEPFAGIEPTGRPIDVTGINIYRFVGDKIVEEFGQVDTATLADQTFGGLDAAACVEALQLLSRPSEAIGPNR